jgi:SPP1 gp7 family putative phage head morphogenesis protein
MRYEPALGYWRATPRRRLWWALTQVYDAVRREPPMRRAQQRYMARLARLWAPPPATQLQRWWQAAQAVQRQAPPPPPPEETLGLPAAVVAGVTAWLQAQWPAVWELLLTLRAEAREATEAWWNVTLPPEVRAAVEAHGLQYTERIAENAQGRMLQLVAAALAATATAAAFARQVRLEWMREVLQRAERIAVTEWQQVAGAATEAALQVRQIRRRAWRTVGDARVCPICRGNGAAGPRPVGQPFPSGNSAPPAHTTCRCWIVEVA